MGKLDNENPGRTPFIKTLLERISAQDLGGSYLSDFLLAVKLLYSFTYTINVVCHHVRVKR